MGLKEFVISSNPALGGAVLQPNNALVKGASGAVDGSTVLIPFPYGFLNISEDAKNVMGQVTSATVWNSVPNIAASSNNNIFRFTANSGSLWTNYTIPDGIYDLPGLNAMVNGLISGGGAALLSMTGITATSQVQITFNAANCQIDFTISNSPRLILGFNSELVPTAGYSTLGQVVTSENIAEFNQINSFYIVSNMTTSDGGIQINNISSQAIADIPILVGVNSQMVYQPLNPVLFSAQTLRGQNVVSLLFALVSDSLVPCNTNGFFYQLRIKLTWEDPKK